jgi:thiol-disulfide isomerase/thioredoxin
MTCRAFSLVLALILGSAVFAQATNIDKSSGPLQEYRALLSKFQECRAELFRSVGKPPIERRQALYERYCRFPPKFLLLAKKYPKEPFALEALIVILANMPDDGFLTDEAIQQVVQDHLTDPKLGETCRRLTMRGTRTSEKLATAVLEHSRDHQLQADALLALAQYWKAKSEAEGISAANAEKYGAQAERFYVRLLGQYADLKGTISEAGPELFEVRHLAVGKEAPDISGQDSAEKKLRLRGFRGKVVLLDFWADWCAACLALVPDEQALLKRMRGKPFALIGVNLDPSRTVMKKSEAKHQITWPSFFDGSEGPITKTWNIRLMPTIFVLDAEGIIRYKGQEMDGARKVAESLVARVEAKR